MFNFIKKLLFSTFLSVINIVHCDENCWTNFDAEQHFNAMDKLDDNYAKIQMNYNEAVGGTQFDKDMLLTLLKNRGKAERAIHAAHGNENFIPAGINLGGYCMMRMPKSLLFFHRMKLRNNTVFRITRLHSDLGDLKMKADILLNDLHLFGSYDFTNILSKPGILSYDPTFGQVELLLKNVTYKMEGHYRLLKNRLNMELIISEIDLEDVLMMYRNRNSTYSVKLQRKNIDTFIDRLKVDLDKWLKDYFNDYLMYYVVAEDTEFEKYSQKKTILLNQYADKVLDKVLERLDELKANAVELPPFEMRTMSVAEITLRDGVLRGLDSIYRRSIATGSKHNKVRTVDTVVGFSNLKLSYRYDATLKSGLPPVTGVLTLTADDLTARMGLSLTKQPATADLSFTFLEQAKPESLTIEGPANRMITNFKYTLERHIIAIMTNTLLHNIRMLGTLDRCVPLLVAYKEPETKVIDPIEDNKNFKDLLESKENKYKIQTDEPMDEPNINHGERHEGHEDIKSPSNELPDAKEDPENSNSEDIDAKVPFKVSREYIKKHFYKDKDRVVDNKAPSQELKSDKENNGSTDTDNRMLNGFNGNENRRRRIEYKNKFFIPKQQSRSKLPLKAKMRQRKHFNN